MHISLMLLFADGLMNSFYLYIIIPKVYQSNNNEKHNCVIDYKATYIAFCQHFLGCSNGFSVYCAMLLKEPDISINMIAEGKEIKVTKRKYKD